MKSRSIHKIFLISLSLFIVYSLAGQQGVTIKATLDKNNIVIGEHIHFKLEAAFPAHDPMRFFEIDTIPHFEILERKKIDTIDNNEGIKLSQSLTLTSFDSGHWVIPPFQLAGDKLIFTDSLPVDVGFSPFDPKQDYHDIKDIIDIKKVEEKAKKDWYWYIAATVLLLAAIIYFLARKKKGPDVHKTPIIDPFIEAKQELEKLRKENLSSKMFYSRLIDIFRVYVFRRKGIASFQKTTDDLVVQLRTLNLPAEDFNRLAQTLRMSDFVKFAKYEPDENDKMSSFNIIKGSIESIQKLPMDISASNQ